MRLDGARLKVILLWSLSAILVVPDESTTNRALHEASISGDKYGGF